jgi:hypothetical protein
VIDGARASLVSFCFSICNIDVGFEHIAFVIVIVVGKVDVALVIEGGFASEGLNHEFWFGPLFVHAF